MSKSKRYSPEVRRLNGDEINSFERYQLSAHQYYNFLIFQNIFTQHKEGLFSEDEWGTYKNIILRVWESNETARDMWKRTPTQWTPEFRKEVDSLVSHK